MASILPYIAYEHLKICKETLFIFCAVSSREMHDSVMPAKYAKRTRGGIQKNYYNNFLDASLRWHDISDHRMTNFF